MTVGGRRAEGKRRPPARGRSTPTRARSRQQAELAGELREDREARLILGAVGCRLRSNDVQQCGGWGDDAVQIESSEGRAVQRGRHTPDQDVSNTVPVQGVDDQARLKSSHASLRSRDAPGAPAPRRRSCLRGSGASRSGRAADEPRSDFAHPRSDPRRPPRLSGQARPHAPERPRRGSCVQPIAKGSRQVAYLARRYSSMALGGRGWWGSTPPGGSGTAASDPALSLFERGLYFAKGSRIATPIWVGGQGALTKGALEVVGRRARRDAEDLPDRGRGRRRGRWPDAGAGALSGAGAPGCLTEEYPGPGARPERLDLDQRNRRGTSGLCQRLVAGSRAARERVGLAKGFARGRCRPPGGPQESAPPRRRYGA